MTKIYINTRVRAELTPKGMEKYARHAKGHLTGNVVDCLFWQFLQIFGSEPSYGGQVSPFDGPVIIVNSSLGG